MDLSSPVRKVPVKIVHAESSSEREGRAYLAQNNEASTAFEPLAPPQISTLGSPEHHASSLFSVYTRQGTQRAGAQHEAADPGQASLSAQRGVDGGANASTNTATSAAGAQEDAKREELARDIMGKDKSLADILDQSGRKTTMDLMEGLFPQEEQILEGAHQRRRTSAGSRQPTSSPRSTDERWVIYHTVDGDLEEHGDAGRHAHLLKKKPKLIKWVYIVVHQMLQLHLLLRLCNFLVDSSLGR